MLLAPPLRAPRRAGSFAAFLASLLLLPASARGQYHIMQLIVGDQNHYTCQGATPSSSTAVSGSVGCGAIPGIDGYSAVSGSNGTLHIVGSIAGAHAASDNVPNFPRVYSYGTWDDVVSWTSPAVHSLVFDVQLYGTTSGRSGPYGGSAAAATVGFSFSSVATNSVYTEGYDSWNTNDGVGFSPSGDQSFVQSYDIRRSITSSVVYGQSTSFHFGIGTEDELWDSFESPQYAATDMYMRLLDIRFLDVNGQDLPQPVYALQSGTELQNEPLGTPEPSSLLFCATGLTTLGMMLWRRRR